MRSERAGITLEAKGRKGVRDGSDEFLQVFVALDAGPEDARGLRVGKESCAAKGERDRGHLDGLERVANFVELGGFAEELQSDVKGFGGNPANVGGEATHLVAEGGDAFANFGSSMSRATKRRMAYITMRRTRSSACWLAQRRMRSRSPGKRRCTVSCFVPSETATQTRPTGFSSVPPPDLRCP